MIPSIRVDVDVRPLVLAMEDFQREQAPFATSRALNDVALKAVVGEQEAMRQNFTIRRPWVLLGIKVLKYSNKKDDPLEVRLGILDDRAFLVKFEKGGMKTPLGFNLSLPSELPGVSKMTVIPASLRPRAFGQWENRRGNARTFVILNGPGAGIWQRTGSGPRQVRMLWSFKQHARIAPLLGYAEMAQATADKWFRERFYVRMDEALATARLK